MKLLEHVERSLNKKCGADDVINYRRIREAIDEVDLLPHQRLEIFASLRRHGVIR